jgi:hypothetical protein
MLAAVNEAQTGLPQDFAEVFLDVVTFATAREREQYLKPQRRVAVCIGISDYADEKINDLTVSHLDAVVMADIFEKQCGVESVVLLTNAQATRRAIEQAIFEDLPARTQPGDTVFIFFSGHGGRCADTNGDEEDGYDEYFVPQDGQLGDDNTMILDDVFARWMQQLEGREVCCLVDCCHAGGVTKNLTKKGSKGITPVNVDRAVDRLLKVDVLEGELRRAKDLGQKGTEIITACQANQLAWEMLPPNKVSVLTHYLADAVKQKAKADANGDNKLGLNEAFHFMKEPIQNYVRTNMQTEQTPLLIDNAGGSIVLVP